MNCKVKNCKIEVKSLGFCKLHYQRFHRTGDPGEVYVRPKRYKLCRVKSCEKKPVSLGYCTAHYLKLRKYGDPTIDRTVKARPCKVDGCEGARFQFGMCGKHARRHRLYGDPLKGKVFAGFDKSRWRVDATYNAAHNRVRRTRGPVDQNVCLQCDKDAAHWAYNNADPGECVSTEGPTKGQRYSANPEFYIPLCVKCHKLFDAVHMVLSADCEKVLGLAPERWDRWLAKLKPQSGVPA